MTTSLRKITQLKFWVRIIVEKDDPGYHAYAPSLKGLHMGGDTAAEALANAREAAELFLKSMIEDGDPIPLDVTVPPRQKSGVSVRGTKVTSLEEIVVNLK